MLYRDIESLFGPLSPYVNALWFRLFGVSLTTLVICNLAILAATTAGIYHVVRVSTDRTTATVAGLATLLLFGFAEYLVVGNYNFVTPYAHDATHGVALVVAMIVRLHRALATGRRLPWAVGGVCFGGVMLTKPETALAAGAVVTAFLMARAPGDSRHGLARTAALCLGAAAAPPLRVCRRFPAAHARRWRR